MVSVSPDVDREGFFIATPSQPSDQPSELQGQVFGFNGHAGPSGLTSYSEVSQGGVSGDGSQASPYEQVTVYDVNGPSSGDPLLQVAQTTTYVNGRVYFTAYYDVKNVTDRLDPSDSNYNSAIYFRARGSITVGPVTVSGWRE